ncbi:MAG: NAD(P)-dependent oxidoreductase [Abitibacteriaceae bacterium]|nr:NAD(P)-dependent oxidoreductase [Abditibacteriaceae bacterium]MBV9867905.1 NAD(P)-dependent oxidoreductase [Abditibacteriaceae bacterium]
MSKSIAFLGTGIMGAPMAVNLLHAGYAVRCYNRTRAKTQPVVDAGGLACDTPAEAAQGVEVIITMVTDRPDVEQVLFGAEGALATTSTAGLCIDMSTISPTLTRDLAQRARQKGARYLDAPVTGGQPGAINGTLSIMVGGDETDFEAACPIFEAMGKTITYCGNHGAGQSVKLCNQICGALNLLGVCEALILGQQQGIDPEIVMTVISAGAGSSWAMQNLAPKIIKGDFAPGFMIDTQQKDMRLVAEAAENAGVPLPGASLAQQLWRAAQVHGWGTEGIQAMAKVLELMANVERDAKA